MASEGKGKLAAVSQLIVSKFSPGRSRVFFDIEINKYKEGRITFELVSKSAFIPITPKRAKGCECVYN